MTKSVSVDTRQIRRLDRDLEFFARKALPYAVKEGLTKSAWAARAEWQDSIRQEFTNRNRWTAGSVQVERATGLDLTTMQSAVGSGLDYMATQESGGLSTRSTGKKPIPTDAARIGKSLSRVVSAGLSTRRIKVGARANSLKQLAPAIRRARAKSSRLIYLRVGDDQGVYRMMGARKSMKLKRLWTVGRSSVRISATPTLEPALRRLQSRLPGIHRDAVIAQLRRAKVLGYR